MSTPFEPLAALLDDPITPNPAAETTVRNLIRARAGDDADLMLAMVLGGEVDAA